MSGNDSPVSPARRYTKRLTYMIESQYAEITLLRKELLWLQRATSDAEDENLRQEDPIRRQICVFSTEEVLRIVREAEEKPKGEKPRGWPRKHPIEEEDLESSLTNLELELDECVARRTWSHVE